MLTPESFSCSDPKVPDAQIRNSEVIKHTHERSVENLLSVPSTPTLANTVSSTALSQALLAVCLCLPGTDRSAPGIASTRRERPSVAGRALLRASGGSGDMSRMSAYLATVLYCFT